VSKSFSGKEVIRGLKKIGFEDHHQRGSHYFLYHPEKNILLIVPYHKELKKGTLNSILKKAGISLEELSKLI